MRCLSSQDIHYALSNYNLLSIVDIAKQLQTTKHQIYMLYVQYHKIQPKYSRPWSNQNIEFLKMHYAILSRKKLAEQLQMTEDDVRYKIVELGLVNINSKKSFQNALTGTQTKFEIDWTEKENDYLRFHATRMSVEEMAQYLGCNKHAVELQMQKLRLPRLGIQSRYETCIGKSKNGIIIGFTDHELTFLKENFGKMDLLELMSHMPTKTTSQLIKCAKHLHLADSKQIRQYFRDCKPFKKE